VLSSPGRRERRRGKEPLFTIFSPVRISAARNAGRRLRLDPRPLCKRTTRRRRRSCRRGWIRLS
jgi:hypothetical protein